jgi:hypothetical protein
VVLFLSIGYANIIRSIIIILFRRLLLVVASDHNVNLFLFTIEVFNMTGFGFRITTAKNNAYSLAVGQNQAR